MNTDDAPIEVMAYDPAWAASFARECALIREVAGPWLLGPIEHVGSTAVPGLVAKPIVDIMAAVDDLAMSRPAIAALARLRYYYAPYRSESMHWFCKPSALRRTHHLHLVPYGSPMWQEKLAFRDRLRQDAELAAQYGQLKQQLAVQYRLDREAYTEAKGPFIMAVTRAALEERATLMGTTRHEYEP